jgi:multidrug efflux pump subunit AcrA (membrane-fusion protein)
MQGRGWVLALVTRRCRLGVHFLIVWAAIAAACGRTGSAAVTTDGASPQAITVARVEAHEVQRTIDVVGTLAAVEEVTVSSEVEGRVLRIAADLGDHVTAGQALVVLDPEKLQYRLDQQRAALGRAMARYGVAELEAPLPSIERTPDLQKAAAELAQAEQAFSRAAELQKRALVPQQQLDDAEAA